MFWLPPQNPVEFEDSAKTLEPDMRQVLNRN
jgi:hypothetical protein